ncbi:MAG: phosphoribosylformylglycinamidine synthase I [Candidatus Thorarchaeota archaeon]|nr:phosphoribosylformylglycinamidine synthase I [Candidatus Thorarchaeota archaeon]
MPIAVLRFPGTNNEKDILQALSAIPGVRAYLVTSHQGPHALKEATGIVIPGGFSYGDYLRAGAVAAAAEVMDGIRDAAAEGRPVLGICNGFQILAEAGLLPGVLLPNESARFVCRWVHLRVSSRSSMFTRGLEDAIIRLPIAHGEGNYHCDAEELRRLTRSERVVFRYCNRDGEVVDEANPNGSVHSIAGVINAQGNVMGMMPHPERASRKQLGSTDGMRILENFVEACLC